MRIIQADMHADSWSDGSGSDKTEEDSVWGTSSSHSDDTEENFVPVSSSSNLDAEEIEELPLPVEEPRPEFTGNEILVFGSSKTVSYPRRRRSRCPRRRWRLLFKGF